MTALLAFDVNETLLDLAPLRDRFRQDFGEAVSLGEWFARVLHGSLISNVLHQYRPFGEIGAEALVTLAGRAGIELTMDGASSSLALMTTAPPYPDVVPAVERMASAGIRMIALTNGERDLADTQIANAGLGPYLERVISCVEVERFKPDPLVYGYAAETMGIPIEELTLVAGHDWDCAGAMAAGADAVFVRRPASVWGLPGEPPPLVVAEIGGLADVLLGT